MPPMRDIVYGKTFSNFIIGVIVFNAVLIGIETYIHLPVFKTIEWICVWIFVAEIALKLRYARSMKEYFTDPWNLFDIIVVGAAFVPAVGALSSALRILRVLRVLRVVKAVPELRLIVRVLAKSMVSMTWIAVLMVIVFYIYAVIGVKFFGSTQPEFATLHEATFTLFRALTLEDWTDVRYDGVDRGNYWVVTFYHVSWVLISTFVMLNLVVGAIINNYHEVNEIEKRRHLNLETSDERILELAAELQELLQERMADVEVRKQYARIKPGA